MLLLGLGAAGFLAWGSHALMGSFPLSRDEHMVVFDMAVFDHGRLAMPLAPEWRPYAKALTPAFLLNERMPTGLVSAYLPMNALLRLAFSKVADPAWFNPLLVVAGGAALLDVARRTFGREDATTCCVVLLIYILSAQVLVNAMTTYSMTAHLAFNLIWLAAFLRGGKAGHSFAIVIGFLAVGLHQLVFHPVFVIPFLLWRFREGERRLVLLYAAAYSAIILFWACYPILAADQVAQSVHEAPNGNLVARITPLLLVHDPHTIGIMVLNLLRFLAWQDLALLPLLVVAVPIAARDRGLSGALLQGLLLWLAFVAFVLPYQGHGWGYRYLHPYIGSVALLAGFGYRRLREHIGTSADGMVITLSALTGMVAIPLELAATYRFVEPHVALERLIAGQKAAMVLIDTQPSPGDDGRWAANAIDHVRNLPDLTNRPLRFSSAQLDAERLIRLCRLSPITLITRADQHQAGFALNVPERSPDLEALVAKAKQESPGCIRAASMGGGDSKPARP